MDIKTIRCRFIRYVSKRHCDRSLSNTLASIFPNGRDDVERKMNEIKYRKPVENLRATE